MTAVLIDKNSYPLLSLMPSLQSNDFSFTTSPSTFRLRLLSYTVNKVHFYISYGTWLHIVIKLNNMYSPYR